MKKLLLLLLCFLFTGMTFAAQGYFSDSNKKDVKPNPIFNSTVVVPVGYILPITLRNSVNSSTLSVADNVEAVLATDFYYNNKLIATEGSSVKGTVVKNIVSSKLDSELFIRFTSIVNQNNQIIPIAGIIKTPDRTGVLKGAIGENIELKQDTTMDLVIMQPITFVGR